MGIFGEYSGTANRVVPVTPDDNTVYNPHLRGLYVGGTGNLAIVAADGSSATLVGVQGGTILPIAVAKVLSTGTTASSIVGLI